MNRIGLPFVVACALVATTAAAQGAPSALPGGAPAGTAPAVRTPPASAAGRSVDSEKLEAAADNIARMKAALKLVLGRAEQARNEKDVVKLNCVNEKLTQVKALIKVAEQADIALHESLRTQDAGEAEFSKVAIARTKVDRLRRDAEQCIGQLAYMVDEKTTVEVEQPSNLPGHAGSGLGVAHRGDNPADSVGDIGSGGFAPSCIGRDAPFCPPPVVRPPEASQYR